MAHSILLPFPSYLFVIIKYIIEIRGGWGDCTQVAVQRLLAKIMGTSPFLSLSNLFIVTFFQVHVLPQEMLGRSTFGLSMSLLRWLPVQTVDRFILFISWLMLGDTAKLGIRRPDLGPLELKQISGKTPVLDVGTLAKIKSGDIKVCNSNWIPFCWLLFLMFSCRSVCALMIAGPFLSRPQVYPGIQRLTRRGAEFVDGRWEEFDAVILATGYISNVPSWLKVQWHSTFFLFHYCEIASYLLYLGLCFYIY